MLATEAFDAAADATRFPEQLSKEGLSVWQVRKLYYGGTNGPTVATIITTGTLTHVPPVAPGERWTTKLAGVDLDGIAVRFA